MTSTKKILIGLFSLGSMVAAGCSSSGGQSQAMTQPLVTSPKVPGAQGMIKVSQTKSANTAIDLKVQHLAPPAKVEPGTHTYVVWQQPINQPNAQPQNIGALNVDPKEEGSLQTVTPLYNFQLFVTAESDIQASQPTGPKLMWAQVNR